MSGTAWDVIVVGRGLAGTTLAWCLHDAGREVLVLDACEPMTASAAAAGLITPITGQRLKKSSQFETLKAFAGAFYRAVEKRTGRRFFYERTALRFLADEREERLWAERGGQPDYRSCLLEPQPVPLIDPGICTDDDGTGFAMHAAQLDTRAFLEASRSVLPVEHQEVDWQRDVTFGGDHVRVGDHTGRFVIACEGHRGADNPHFRAVPFKSVKGDILTVRFNRPLPDFNLHRGIWVAPTGEPDLFRVGATYDREYRDNRPDPAARQRIEDRLKAFIRVPYRVVDHAAGIRPALRGDRVLIGLHPDHRRLGFFNGLGSKGALQAPWHADRLTRLLVDDEPLPADMDVAARMIR